MPQGRMTGAGMWEGAGGLADDVRYYGQWMRDRAFERIGHLYPKVKLPAEQGSGEATVIAWLWARTVTCPNPACGAKIPLCQVVCTIDQTRKESLGRAGVDYATKTVRFLVRSGEPTGSSNAKRYGGRNREESGEGRSVALFVESVRRRVNTSITLRIRLVGYHAACNRRRGHSRTCYVEADKQEQLDDPVAESQKSADSPAFPDDATSARLSRNVCEQCSRPHTVSERSRMISLPRQLVALTTFSDLVS